MANNPYPLGHSFYGNPNVPPLYYPPGPEGQPNFLLPIALQPNVVQLGVPLDVVHIDGTPMSMYLQLLNEPFINFIQNELQATASDPNFATSYAINGPPQVIVFEFI